MKIWRNATVVLVFALLISACNISLPPQLFLPELVLGTETIPASDEPTSLPVRTDGFAEAEFFYTYEGQRKKLADYLNDAHVRGFLILHHGEIVYEYYRAPYSKNSRQQSWSMAKQVLSILVGVALDEGIIDSIDDPMDRYDPRLASNGFAGISFRQALQMSSGVLYNEIEDRQNLFFDVIDDQYSSGESGATLTEKVLSPELTRDYAPDSRWQYTSINSQAIAMALATAAGKPLKQFLWEKLWNPLGIPQSARILVDRENTEFSFCCLYASARSFAKIGELYANAGRYNGQQIVPADWVRLSTTQADPRSWSGAEGAHPEGVTSDHFGFAYHWWTLKGERGDFTALGVYGQSIHIFPSQDIVIVRLSGDYTEGAHREESLVLNRAIADYLQ